MAFQIAHFGDDSVPDCWFVDATTAMNPDSAGLGCYEDGGRRTITDDQIAMFRHSEIEQLLRERRLQRANNDERLKEDEVGPQHLPLGSPRSDVSSIEGDLLGLTRVTSANSQPAKASVNAKAHRKRRSKCASSRGHSESSRSSGSLPRQRRHEVPYEKRHKRKWEDFVDQKDPVHGSMTHRRLVRQLDEQDDTGPAIDYGEDDSAAPRKAHQQTPPGRRVISYGDD